MTSNLEKVFMNWIFKNPEYFSKVDVDYFENRELKFIFKCVKKEFENSVDKIIPSNTEIIDLVKLKDKEDTISADVIKIALDTNFDEYRQEFIEPRIKSWIIGNSTKKGLVDSIEQMQTLDFSDVDGVTIKVENIRNIINESTSINFDTNGLGSDFDDPDAHNQESHVNKITTGFTTMDTIMGGGWDRKTLNIFSARTGVGKSNFLQNFSVNAADAGYNVAYITLELSEKKVLKRLGSMRLNIPINEYDTCSRDREFMRLKIEETNKKREGIFDNSVGKIWVKEFSANTATIVDIENYIKLVHTVTNKTVDVLVVDYIQTMSTERRLQIDSNLYLKGKHLAEGLRSIAQRYNLACLSATQIVKDSYDAGTMGLKDMSESKAIPDTSDSVWGIIRTPEMELAGKYHLKWLKLRDCSTDYEKIRFDYNKKTLKIHSDTYHETI